jgi:hypothetical protein
LVEPLFANLAPLPPFVGPRLKLARALELVTELKEVCSGFMSRSPIEMEFDAQFWLEPGLVFKLLEPMPQTIPCIVGDILHNFRSALDAAACDAARAVGLQDTREVYYPFCASAAHLELMIAKRKLSNINGSHLQIIMDSKPFLDGNTVLRRLHDLDIIDKHNGVLYIVYMLNINGIGGIGLTADRSIGPLGFLGWSAAEKPDAGLLELVPLFDFKEDPVLGTRVLNDPVFEVLEEIASTVKQIVEDLAAA